MEIIKKNCFAEFCIYNNFRLQRLSTDEKLQQKKSILSFFSYNLDSLL